MGALAIDAERVEARCVAFIRRIVDEAGAQGAVVGLSGGVDSAVVAALCVRALGAPRVFALLMPLPFTPEADTRDAQALARQLGVSHAVVPVGPVEEALARALDFDPSAQDLRIVAANLRARARMVLLYYYANARGYLVAGTGDRSEDMIGFFTKYGDGGVDFLPIAHLYKTQVRALAAHLAVPAAIAEKPSSPQLYPGHLATDEIPLGYEEMDPVLAALLDDRVGAEEAARSTGVPLETVREIERRIRSSAHKRAYPPMVDG